VLNARTRFPPFNWYTSMKFFLVLVITATLGIVTEQAFGGTGTSLTRKVPTFTLDQAILTALQRNPDLLRAEQEIKRTKGVAIEIRAQALPHITASGDFEWTDPNLTGATQKTTGSSSELSDISYSISVLGKQLVFNGTTWPAIRGTFFQRDSAYFAFRNTLDQLIATVKTQFYQVVFNRELIKVQE
jgi:outer membrane protein